MIKEYKIRPQDEIKIIKKTEIKWMMATNCLLCAKQISLGSTYISYGMQTTHAGYHLICFLSRLSMDIQKHEKKIALKRARIEQVQKYITEHEPELVMEALDE